MDDFELDSCECDSVTVLQCSITEDADVVQLAQLREEYSFVWFVLFAQFILLPVCHLLKTEWTIRPLTS